MTGEGNREETDHVMSFLNGGDITQIDQDKWATYLDKHKLSSTKSRQESQSPDISSSPEESQSNKPNRRVPPPPVRMVTRGVSGAVRPKSVEEILSSLDQKDLGAPCTPTPRSTSPSKQSSQVSPSSRKDKATTTIKINSTLVDSDLKDSNEIVYNGFKLSDFTSATSSKENEPLNLYAWHLKATYFPLYKQLQTARKTLSTHDWLLARDELKSVKAIQKIEALKKKNLWSLRQLKKHKAPPRAKSHWDCMLDEMKWMHTDFKEERKWKIASAYMIAKAVLEWHNAEDKSTVCLKTRIPEPKNLIDSPTSMIADDKMTLETIPKSIEEQVDSITSPNHMQELSDNVSGKQSTDPMKTDVMMGSTADLVMDETEKKAAASAISDSMPSTPNTAVASLSSDVIQEYRNTIKNLDPYTPIITLPMEDLGDFSANALFPDLLNYEPPNPDFNDPYFNELEFSQITPISRLSLENIKLKVPERYSRKRDVQGNPILIRESITDNIKTLPKLERYNTTSLVSPLFASRKQRDLPAQQPTAPKTPKDAQPSSVPWSEEDDLCLIPLIAEFSFNWDLICDAFNSARYPMTGYKRTAWECHERWRRKNLTNLFGQVNNAYTSKLIKELNRRPMSMGFDSAQKRQRQFGIFEAMKKTAKKREEAETHSSTSSAPPHQTIEVHGTNSAGQRLPTAMEMSLHKAQRERQMAQAMLEQRQLSAALNLGSQAAALGHRNNTPQPQPQTPQPQPQAQTPLRPPLPSNIAAVAAAQARAAVAATRSPTVDSQNQVRPHPMPIPQTANAAGLPVNRYPAAQLQLLRQQQMMLMAAAQQQAQQQQLQAAGANGQARPLTPAALQRFASALQAQQQQQQQQLQQQLQLQQAQAQTQVHGQHPTASQAQLQQLAQQHAQVQAQTQAHQQAQLLAAQQHQQLAKHTTQQTPVVPSAETVAQQVSQMASPAVTQQQQSPQPHPPAPSQTTPQSSPQPQIQPQVQPQQPQQLTPQQQQQQAALAAQLQAAQANPLMFAAQLAQMGYPISQLPANQQLQLQRYLAHLQMRNTAVAAATAAAVSNGNPNTTTAAPTNNKNNNSNPVIPSQPQQLPTQQTLPQQTQTQTQPPQTMQQQPSQQQ
ncbi:hypothetical protein BDF20DRAFT_913480 [Mycotypha africana]|uniref:uncharacterized protein n=1 Tax=Mycotypha africana TaxID=64632 RepID=UPI002301CAFF|nr:uncharacterized protein BDF20DRAFT_913480 [Mycotypha africana]KAI8977108.1 hypothetical protein BDF20DRAFT_913480 [Mycotypha africana]